jgi:D-alanyl-D-alanine carboxypeptidase
VRVAREIPSAYDRPVRKFLVTAVLVGLVATGVLSVPASGEALSRHRTTDAAIEQLLKKFVGASGGPIGGIVTLHRNGRTQVLSAGRADAHRAGAPRLGDHMRIASITKAFTAAVALHLVQQHKLKLDQTIGELLPGEMPASWSKVTVREMLDHTSDLPDYTKSDGLIEQATNDPHGFVTPAKIIDWVRADDHQFTPGAKFEYSNTDNIVVALIAEKLTHTSFSDLLRNIVFKPAGLGQTSFNMHRLALPAPFLHGYIVNPGKEPEDVTTALSPSGAWASGAIVSTPGDLGKFIRADLSGKFFGRSQRRSQMRFVKGSSSPAGPGQNSAGLGLFRYRTRCGVVYGHTGNFPGYVQWAAATADGKRSVTTSFNIPAPDGALLKQMRSLQAAAVCALLGK